MFYWKLIGIIATLVIILSIPLYLIKAKHHTGRDFQAEILPTFVGSMKCRDCHKNEFDKWQGSHHDHAMHVANKLTVLGDFNDAIFENNGVQSRFYRKGEKFFVKTLGPEGKMGDFQVTHTFGWYPLQQYLVPFPGGRLQCLPIAWNEPEKKWYHLYPDPVNPKDWLYWTNAGQNWNGMCAECHSTNLKKNYDPATDTFATTWSEINVGCEACHGPGSSHVAWAETPEMGRADVENYDLAVKTSRLNSRELVELCAPCHSRRAALGDYTHSEPDLLDSLLPSQLNEGLYYPDGQILEEVYVYGSFTQSKMYHREVACSDCHDVHSLKLVKEGNDLCLQCHREAEYNTKTHHFHKQKGETGDPILNADGTVAFEVGTGAKCIQCHMPGRTYMGIDYRPDHSLRIPRPDLSGTIHIPNACTRCHFDKSVAWSDETVTQWYGPGRRDHYGTILSAGRKGSPQAEKNLMKMAEDPLYPVIVRATALSLLTAYPGEGTRSTFEIALMDEEALIRQAAVNGLAVADEKQMVKLLAPLLYDPVKAVRIEAARRLAGKPAAHLKEEDRKVFNRALAEFEKAMLYAADFAYGRFNLANLDMAMGRPEAAIQNYEAAIAIDDLFYPAKVNLAMLLNGMGKKDQAEKLLRQVVDSHPQQYQVAYSLGLLLAEKKKYHEAARYLAIAAHGMPGHARVHYNLGMLLDYLGKDLEAEKEFLKTLEIEPENIHFLTAAAQYYVKRKKYEKAKALAQRIAAVKGGRKNFKANVPAP